MQGRVTCSQTNRTNAGTCNMLTDKQNQCRDVHLLTDKRNQCRDVHLLTDRRNQCRDVHFLTDKGTNVGTCNLFTDNGTNAGTCNFAHRQTEPMQGRVTCSQTTEPMQGCALARKVAPLCLWIFGHLDLNSLLWSVSLWKDRGTSNCPQDIVYIRITVSSVND